MAFWVKQGLIFSVHDVTNRPHWFHSFAQAPNAVVLDDRIRVYFCCRPKPDQDGMYVSYGSFVDLERHDPTQIIALAQRPIISLGGLGMFDEFGTYPISVIKIGQEFLAYYGGWSRCRSVPFNVSIGLAKSIDGGTTFIKSGSGPILSHSLDEPFVITSPKIRKFGDLFWLTYTAGQKWFFHQGRPEIVYKLRSAFSKDGINWTRLGYNLIRDKIGPDEAQACGDIFFSNGIYHMFFCYRGSKDFRLNRNHSYRIGYASSLDLYHWERDDSKVTIDISVYGWDSEMVAYPNIFSIDERIYMLYLGNGVGRDGFGIACLDGYLS